MGQFVRRDKTCRRQHNDVYDLMGHLVQKHEGAAGRLAPRARCVEGGRPRPEVGRVRGRHGSLGIRQD